MYSRVPYPPIVVFYATSVISRRRYLVLLPQLLYVLNREFTVVSYYYASSAGTGEILDSNSWIVLGFLNAMIHCVERRFLPYARKWSTTTLRECLLTRRVSTSTRQRYVKRSTLGHCTAFIADVSGPDSPRDRSRSGL